MKKNPGAYKHGMSHTKTYKRWTLMKGRCKPNYKDRKYYLDRGITVCHRWLEDFRNFLDDMGEVPEGMTLDRIDNNKGYYPENCRWVPLITNIHNSRHVKKD